MVAMISSVTAVLANSFGGRLLRGERIGEAYTTLVADDHHQRPDEEEAGGSGLPIELDLEASRTPWLDTVIDGHPWRYWLTTMVLMSTVVVGFGAWWS